MTFSELQQEVLGWLDEQDDTDVTLPRVKAALNAAHRQRCTEQDWDFLNVETTFTLTAGDRTVTLPTDCRQVKRLYNHTKGFDYLEVPAPALGLSPIPSATNTHAREFYIRAVGSPGGGGVGASVTQALQLVFFAPPEADSVELHYRAPILPMVVDSAEPLLPEEHHDLLVWDALITMKAYHTDAEALPVWRELQRAAHDALLWNHGMGAHTIGGQPTYIRYVP
jgi:hypothetical protein